MYYSTSVCALALLGEVVVTCLDLEKREDVSKGMVDFL